jgi:hypothetical protein
MLIKRAALGAGMAGAIGMAASTIGGPGLPGAAALLRWIWAGLEARSAEAGQPEPSWREVQRAAKAAHDSGDFQAYRAHIQRLFELISGHPDTVFAMAKAEARLGHAAAALDWLNAFAAMGLVRDAAAEPDLASLRQVEGFAAVLARLDANRRAVSRSTRVLTVPDRELLTEDIAFDPAARRFFVSSIRQGKIVALDARGGAATDFVPAGRDGIWGVMALAVDARRGVLWATTAAIPEARGYHPADAGHTAVLRYDLATGKLQKRYDLPLPPAPPPAPEGATSRTGGAAKGEPAAAAQAGATAAAPAGGAGGPAPAERRDRVLGDMTLGSNGDVFVSEAVAGAVYTIGRQRDVLETLVPAGIFVSPQTPAATPDGRRLLVADYVRGIGVVDLATHAVSWMAHPREVAVNGIDGLYLVGDTLVAVQNGTEPNRVIRLYLDKSLTRILRWEPLESNSPGLGQPTHGTVVGKDFFFLANSGWDQMADDGSVKPGAVLTPPAVMRVAL